jgi:hypothetical protein
MPENIETKLEKETLKWLERIEKEMPKIKIKRTLSKEKIDSVLENVNAYISDCKHFLEKGDIINAFEAVVYAWGILETCQHLGIIKR